MSTNKDLLKQAIAEAKTIRETAIANAKEALEESITPHLREMLAMKLQEMEEGEDSEHEFGTHLDGTPLEDPKKHMVAEEEDDETPEEDENEPTEEEGEENKEGEEDDEDLDFENMSKEEFTDLVLQIVHEDEAKVGDMTGMEDGEEEINITELLRELEEGVLNEKGGQYMKEPSDAATGGADAIAAAIKTIADKTGKSYDAISQFLFGGKKSMPAEFEEGVQQDLQEALRTVQILRSQLQEVNLLNAKLLYVNKVFKANNLTEGQKVNVVAAFDKAETVKEVKLVFETVSKNVVAKQPVKQVVREHKSFASKPAGSTQKQVINEVSEAVNRMQILAGIKQREF